MSREGSTSNGLAASVQSTNLDGSMSSPTPQDVPDTAQGTASTAPRPSAESTAPSAAKTPAARQPAVSGKVPWTPFAVFAWFMLGIIRGTTSIMLALAVDDISEPVIIMLRSPGTVALFALIMVIWSCHSPAMKENMIEVLKTPSTYVKLTVLGVIQSGGPFLLFAYGLAHVPASFGGAFMALVPAFTVVVDQTIFRALGFKTGKVNRLKVLGMFVIALGILVYITPTIMQDYSPYIQDQCRGVTNSTLSVRDRNRLCASTGQIVASIFELLGGGFLFGLAAVFWRNFKGNIHFTLAGGGQTVVGGLVAIIVWGAADGGKFDPNWTPAAIGALVYLMTCSGLIAAMTLFYLYGKIGAVPTSRVMCLVPVVSWIEGRIIYGTRGSHGIGIEAVGLIVLIAGLILFEGRVDQVCGVDVPCVKMYERRKARKRFTAGLQGDAEVHARRLSTHLLEDAEFDGVEAIDYDQQALDEMNIAHEEMARYSSSVGEFEIVF